MSEGFSQRRLLLAAGLAVSAWLLFIPAKQLTTEHLRIVRLESRLAAVQKENRRMDLQAKRLKDPAEVELLARSRLGWARPGERAYLLVPGPTPAAVAETARGRPSWWSVQWSRLARLIAGKR
jgi:cell division protein FtsB